MRWTCLDVALGLLALPSTALADPDVLSQGGLLVSVTPGYRVPLGVGAYFESGPVGEVERADRTYNAFLQAELRGMSNLRVALGSRFLIGGPVGGSAGGSFVVRSRGGPAVSFEAGVHRVDVDSTLRLSAETTLPFFPDRFDDLPEWHGAFAQEHSLIVSAGVNPPFLRVGANAPGSLVGRPLRASDGQLLLPDAAALVDARASRWLHQGRIEQASVPAFRQIAAELQALGAPSGLVGRALRCARDEMRHAVLCYGMVQRSTGRPVLVGETPRWSIRGGDRRHRLRRLAEEALWDGVIGEGQAAALATRRRDVARDEIEARVQHVIATDESRHAAFAGSVLRWTRRELTFG